MKKIILLPLLLFLFSKVFCQNMLLTPVVDERTELLSVVFNLAGAEEYTNGSVKQYSQSMQEYFKSYSDHEVVKIAKKLRNKNGVAYDAVMSMAIHITIKNDSIFLIDNVEKKSLDERWGHSAKKFVLLLNGFYRESNFHYFFSKNQVLYAEAVNRFTEISKNIDLDWFAEFFGEKPEGDYHLVLSFINYGNYGPSINYKNGRKDIYSIISAWNTDSLGYPVYSAGVSETIVHELSHSFCNPLGDKYFAEMKVVADSFYNINFDKMRVQAYGNAQTMINEILVRASTIIYFQTHGKEESKIRNLIRYEQTNGFIWIEPLIEKLIEYENNRSKYATLESFMPEIVKLQNGLSPGNWAKELAKNSPKIVSFSINNNSTDVDPNTKEITVCYDKPMSSRGISKGKGGDETYPKITSFEWKNENKTEAIIRVELLPDKEYSMKFCKIFNQDQFGFVLDKDYELNFKTKK